jgi:hypothetical protein
MIVVCVIACGASNGPFSASIADGLQPRMSAEDALGVTRAYLDAQRGELAASSMHRAPRITAIWAVASDHAALLDGCIPAHPPGAIVWVTKGEGDYLNLSDHPWSPSSFLLSEEDVRAMTCSAPGPQGTLVIDDATGAILGVYPESPGYPHPSPAADPSAGPG